LSAAYTELVSRNEPNFWFGAVALAVALLLGGLHAVAPGHGKTIMAAYLVSAEGTARQAATIGLTVATTHTVGVLGLAVLLTTTSAAPEHTYPWLAVISGTLLVTVGVSLLRGAVRRLRTGAPGHHHSHAVHGDHHEHVHGASGPAARPADPDGHGQATRPAGSHGQITRPRRRTLIGMGVIGGLVPSPSALLVLLGGIALGRAWFAFLLVVAYGLGMAATLAGTGLALARGAALLRARRERTHVNGLLARLATGLPLLSSSLVVAVGIGALAGAVSGLA
jgi:ABC-type nickel/cobalt efflux system permease component RcnA